MRIISKFKHELNKRRAEREIQDVKDYCRRTFEILDLDFDQAVALIKYEGKSIMEIKQKYNL